jgi:hypothetical protein
MFLIKSSPFFIKQYPSTILALPALILLISVPVNWIPAVKVSKNSYSKLAFLFFYANVCTHAAKLGIIRYKLTQRNVQNHHHNKASNKSKSCNIGIFIALCFWNHFFYHHINHSTCSKSKCIR